MNSSGWTSGITATLQEILDGRELRSRQQQSLLSSYPHPLIVLTLNIAGPCKVFPLAQKTFEEGLSLINDELSRLQVSIVYFDKTVRPSGYEAYFSIDADAAQMKKQMILIEDNHPLGRLFDIDVISPAAGKLSREMVGSTGRTCLLCENPVFLCSRNRAHSLDEILGKELAIMESYYINHQATLIASLFQKAMIYEVSTTPKPGLVDRLHTGSHQDMDIDLFMDSADVLRPYFYKCACAGLSFREEDLTQLFSQLRQLGLEAEKDMFTTTNGVNTHKGLVFSGGILCAAMGYSYVQGSRGGITIPEICRRMLVHLNEDFNAVKERGPRSHGERLYLEHGLSGIRGEAMKGYPIVMNLALPIFKECMKKGYSLYKSGRITLLYLIANSEDTNIMIRADVDTWLRIKEELQGYLDSHPIGTYDEEQLIRSMDDSFVSRNISPGGSADLLALVYALYFWEVHGLAKVNCDEIPEIL